jgi:hypothetical protein
MGKQSRRPYRQNRRHREGGDDLTPLFAAYFRFQTHSAHVVLQCGVKDHRRILAMTPEQARGIAEGLRRCRQLAQEQYAALVGTTFPTPVGVTDEDDYFGVINAWGKRAQWIAPGADLGQYGGLAAAHGHVVLLQPNPQRHGRYVVTYFGFGDVDTLADWLVKHAGEADEHATVHNLMIGMVGPHAPIPTIADILEIARGAPWPPSEAETIAM